MSTPHPPRLPSRTPVRPVRRRVLLGAIVAVVVLLLLALEGIDLLRHPPTGTEPLPSAVDADPRVEIECPVLDAGSGDDDGDVVPVPDPAAVTSNALYDCPAVFDGRPVVYEGEVVGAVLRRGDTAWVHLNDDVYSGVTGPLPAHRDFQGGNGGVGVRIPAALADEITTVGGPTARGDVLRVEGVFHRVDADTREAAVIVATAGQVAAVGTPFVDPVLPDRAVAAQVLGLLALGLVALERVTARRRR